MGIRIAAIGVSHWHSLYDAAYLRRLARMPDIQLVGLHDADPQIATRRSAAVGNPPIFTDYAQMQDETHPDLVLLRVITTQGTETLPTTTPEPPYMLILRQPLEHWQRGAPPPVSVHDCYGAGQLIDQAYEMAGQPYGVGHC
jgi:hypothetical protein